MFSVFSDKKPSQKIIRLKTCAGGSYTRLLIAGPEEEPLYMLKGSAIFWLKWINKKILFELPYASDKTIAVRLRIATSMLNKLEETKIIPKDICLKYHERLIENSSKLVSAIRTEDLPF